MRSTSTRWLISSVGTIDSDGIRNGFTRNAWIRSASPSATATIITSSSSEPLALFSFFSLSRRKKLRTVPRAPARLRLRPRAPARPQPPQGPRSPAPPQRPPDCLARPGADLAGLRLALAGVRLLAQVDRLGLLLRALRVHHHGLLGEQRRLRARVLALADARAAADAAAQVVELRAPDVAAAGDLDPLDLRRVDRERPLDADAERLLADGERLADAGALALEHRALEHLRTAAGALDDLEVDLDAVPRVEVGDAFAQLLALEILDDLAHGNKRARGPQRPARERRMVVKRAAVKTRRRKRLCSSRHSLIRAWSPERSTSGTSWPRQLAGRV